MIFDFHQEAATMAYLTRTVLRGAAPQRGAKKHAALRVGLKCPVCFVVGSRRLVIESRLDPPSRIRDISDPPQSRRLLGHAPKRRYCGYYTRGSARVAAPDRTNHRHRWMRGQNLSTHRLLQRALNIQFCAKQYQRRRIPID